MFKFIGFMIGMVADGFLGGFIGLIIGAVIDSLLRGRVVVQHRRSSTDFTRTLLIFSAALMKVDEKATRSELQYVRDFFARNMGIGEAGDALSQLKDILEQEYDLAYVCNDFRNTSSYPERLLVIQFLFGLAAADNYVDSREVELIERIAGMIGVGRYDYESLKAMFIGGYQNSYSYSQSYSSQSFSSSSNLDLDYKILEVSPDATDAEIKKAYRELAKKHHPDKVNHLGEEMKKAAEEKFSKLNQAYERIKKARNFN